jgi:carbonic anhydrase
MPFRNVEENVRAGVQRLVESPLLPAAYLVHGFVYDVAEGRLHEID